MSVHLPACPHRVLLTGAPAGWLGRAWAQAQTLLAAPGPVQWALPPACATSLYPQQGSILKVTTGLAWVTLRGATRLAGSTAAAHDSAPRDSGDYFLHAGDSLPVAAGQHLVLEAAGPAWVQGVLVRA